MLEFNLAKKGEDTDPPVPAEGSARGGEGTQEETGRTREKDRGRKE